MVHSPDADPVGDLNLKLGSGEGTKYIRVSSKVLTLSSSVFAAMLSPRFSEGRALATLSTGSTTTISLPDDDVEAILWLCEALHFKKSITEEISFELLKKLAVVCDKYDMSKTLSPWVQAWMEKWKGTLGGEDCYTEMVWISYAFGHHTAFWRNTRILILRSNPRFLKIARNVILPDSIVDFISAERTEALDQLQRTVETIILPHLQHICPAEAQHESRTNSCEHLSKIGHYLQSLCRLGLWPLANFQTSNVSNIANRLLRFQNYDRNPAEHYLLNGVYYVGCQTPQTDLKVLIKQAAEDAVEMQKGLCLACIRLGKVTKEEGNCRAEKETLCDTQQHSILV